MQFATAMEERLLSLVSADEFQELRRQGKAELQEPGRWGTTFTLIHAGAGPGSRLEDLHDVVVLEHVRGADPLAVELR